MSLRQFWSGLRKKFGNCLVTTCEEGGCKLSLEGLSEPNVCICGDRYQEYFGYQDKLCDCIILWQEKQAVGVAVVELKSGHLGDIVAIREQLQNGADLIDNNLVVGQIVTTFRPFVLHGKRERGIVYKVLRNKRVYFRGQAPLIDVQRCGFALVNALKP